MKNEKSRYRNISYAQIISLLTTAISLIVAIFVILFDNKRINIISSEDIPFALMLLVSLSVPIIFAYMILILRRINPKQYIYFSYARADKEIVDTVKETLEAQLSAMSKYRFEILTADSIPYGADIKNTLQEYKSKANVVVVIISRNYTLSDWCATELIEVLEMGKRIIPIITDSYEELSELPRDIRNIKALSIKGNLSQEELKRSLKMLAKDLVRAQSN